MGHASHEPEMYGPHTDDALYDALARRDDTMIQRWRHYDETENTTYNRDVILCATIYKALSAWEDNQEATILKAPRQCLWAVGHYPDVMRGHETWRQVSPEELEDEIDHE